MGEAAAPSAVSEATMKTSQLVSGLSRPPVCTARRLRRRRPAADADALVTDFVYQSLALSAGFCLGRRLPRARKRAPGWALGRLQRRGPRQARPIQSRCSCDRLDALQHARLDAERLADLDIIRDAVSLKLLELDRIQDFRHNPTLYVELIGNGLYTPFVLNYAPAEVRFQDLIGRLQRLPALVAQARANLQRRA